MTITPRHSSAQHDGLSSTSECRIYADLQFPASAINADFGYRVAAARLSRHEHRQPNEVLTVHADKGALVPDG